MNKKIKLGVREFDIPELAIRQRRVVVPLALKLTATMTRIRDEKSIASLTTQEYTDIQEIVYQGITRGVPKFDREAFLDFVFDETELINAFSVVVSQAGFASGEAQGEAAAPNSPPTGTNTSTT